jgi:hypothetical protein
VLIFWSRQHCLPCLFSIEAAPPAFLRDAEALGNGPGSCLCR